MYKVFVNEKKLSINNSALENEKNIKFEDETSIEIAIDLLENTSNKGINLYHENVEKLWETFNSYFKIIKAAGGIVFNQENKILFIYRLGKWDLPKGKIESGESLVNAALREVEEETGLKNMEVEDFINQTFHIYKEKRFGNDERILKTTYWFRMKFNGDEKPIPQKEEGITKVEFMGKDKILEYVFPNTFQNIKLILNEAL